MTKQKNTNVNEKKPRLPLVFKIGMAFLIISPLRYLVLLGLPWLPYSNGVKVGIWLAIFIAAEILFWIGAFLVGEEVVRKYKEYLKPGRYFKKKK